MALTKGNMRALIAMLKQACQAAGACTQRFQEMYEDAKARANFVQELTVLIQETFGRFNPFNTDRTVEQIFFEPENWSQSLDMQLRSLRVYLPGVQVDHAYLERRKVEPVPTGFTRVAVPKLAYLERILQPARLESDESRDIYTYIGVAIEHVCCKLDKKRSNRFWNQRKGLLTPDRVRCHERAAERRQQAEAAVPGDILILDVDLGNYTLGGKKRICHTSRWSREEIGLTGSLLDLSAVDVGWILLLNGARQTKRGDLNIIATLEEFNNPPYGWVNSSCWWIDDNRLLFGHTEDNCPYGRCVAGVALLPGVAVNSYLDDSA